MIPRLRACGKNFVLYGCDPNKKITTRPSYRQSTLRSSLSLSDLFGLPFSSGASPRHPRLKETSLTVWTIAKGWNDRLAFRIPSTQCTSEVHLRKRVALVISLFGGGLKAETVGEKSGERIPCLRTSRQHAGMVVHGRCMRACTVWYKVYLGVIVSKMCL